MYEGRPGIDLKEEPNNGRQLHQGLEVKKVVDCLGKSSYNVLPCIFRFCSRLFCHNFALSVLFFRLKQTVVLHCLFFQISMKTKWMILIPRPL